MHIGTVRSEEARIHDNYEGYHSFHAEETQDEHGSLEVFWSAFGAFCYEQCGECDGDQSAAGWYWWACFPGCLPDGEPSGPFATSRDALEDADEWNPEFNDDDS